MHGPQFKAPCPTNTYRLLSAGFLSLAFVVFLIGGGRVYADSFYQKSASTYSQSSLQVSCITNQQVKVGSSEYDRLLDQTRARVKKGVIVNVTASHWCNLYTGHMIPDRAL